MLRFLAAPHLYVRPREMLPENRHAVRSRAAKLREVLFCVAALAAAGALPGCFTIPEYPSALPPLSNVDTKLEICPSIAGTYRDDGAAFAPDGRALGAVSLTALLHSNAAKVETAEWVLIKGPEGDDVEIDSYQGPRRVADWHQSKVTKQAYLRKGDRVVAETYLCQDGFVRLGRKYDVGGVGTPGLLVVGVRSDFLWLRRAIDGSLIVLHTNWEYAVIDLVLPVGGVDKLWYRFLPAVRSTS
jgi:hypothetical protein